MDFSSCCTWHWWQTRFHRFITVLIYLCSQSVYHINDSEARKYLIAILEYMFSYYLWFSSIRINYQWNKVSFETFKRYLSTNCTYLRSSELTVGIADASITIHYLIKKMNSKFSNLRLRLFINMKHWLTRYF